MRGDRTIRQAAARFGVQSVTNSILLVFALGGLRGTVFFMFRLSVIFNCQRSPESNIQFLETTARKQQGNSPGECLSDKR